MSTTSFALDARLQADTLALQDLSLSALRLMNDARWRWLILVPRLAGATELGDLSRAQQHALMDEIDSVSRALRAVCQPHRLNVAALGNVVAQLHVHVIARDRDDPAWPAPVWGRGAAEPYPQAQAQALSERLIAAMADG